MIEIKSEFDGAVECLPLLEETELFHEWCDVKEGSLAWKLMVVYQALENVENYYQFNSPTAFGNPNLLGYSTEAIREAVNVLENYTPIANRYHLEAFGLDGTAQDLWLEARNTLKNHERKGG